jgi:putative cell wall-binding protein
MSKSRSGASKRMAAGLLAGSLAVFGLALASPAGAVADVDVERLAGATRYGTAAAIAGEDPPGAFTGADTAILATGENFPDALAASGLAGTNAPAPILLTRTATLSEEALAALDELAVANVIIVGGTAAVSDDVEGTLEDEGFTVTRVAGTNRFGTAAAIADEVGPPGDGVVLIANGMNFPDALAGGPLSYAGGHPILLVTPTDIPAETEAALEGATNAIILGGTAAVSNEVQAEIDEMTGGDSFRLAGVNRFETAEAIADHLLANNAGDGFDGVEILLASGQNFPDALAGGPLGGELGAPIILTGPACESDDWIAEHSDTIELIWALGGTAAQSDETLAACEDAAEDTEGAAGANATATSRPELVSATITTVIASNATATRPAGTYVTYCFDEAVTGRAPNPALFKVWNGDGTPVVAEVAVVTQGNNKCIEGRFGSTAGTSAFDTVAEASVLTLATVARDAVTGAGGASDTGIEGDAALTPTGASTAPAAAGVTSGPDLVSVGNFRAGFSEDVTAVDFTFDEAAFTNNISGYQLVTTNNDLIQCTGPAEDTTTVSGGTVAGGEGTTVHTVLCNEPPLGATFSTASIVRGVVLTNTVDDTDTFAAPGNPTQAADVSASGNSDGPSLDGVIFAPDATAGVDVVAFLFSEAVTAAPVAANFAIYDVNGNELAPAFGAARSTENNSVVTAVFPDGTLSTAVYVGGNVDTGAVTDLQGEVGRADEAGTTPSAGTARTSGKTDGPDLTGVAITRGTSPFGNATATATYTFDEDTADNADLGAVAGENNTQGGEEVVVSGLHLYTADGIRLDCTATSATSSDTQLGERSEDADNTVTCISYVVGGTATAATVAQIASATVGTVEAGAVADEAAGGDTNPEGHSVTTGGSGTPAA